MSNMTDSERADLNSIADSIMHHSGTSHQPFSHSDGDLKRPSASDDQLVSEMKSSLADLANSNAALSSSLSDAVRDNAALRGSLSATSGIADGSLRAQEASLSRGVASLSATKVADESYARSVRASQSAEAERLSTETSSSVQGSAVSNPFSPQSSASVAVPVADGSRKNTNQSRDEKRSAKSEKKFASNHAYTKKKPLDAGSPLRSILGFNRDRRGHRSYHYKYVASGKGGRPSYADIAMTQPRIPEKIIDVLRERLADRDSDRIPERWFKSRRFSVSLVVMAAILRSGLLTPDEADVLADANSPKQFPLLSRMQRAYDEQMEGSSARSKLDRLLKGQADLRSQNLQSERTLGRLKRVLLFPVYAIMDLVADLWAVRVGGFTDFNDVKQSALKTSTVKHLARRDDKTGRNRLNEITDAALNVSRGSVKRQKHREERKHQRNHFIY